MIETGVVVGIDVRRRRTRERRWGEVAVIVVGEGVEEKVL